MRIWCLLLINFFFISAASADCDDANRKCKNECLNEIAINGKSIVNYKTDFQNACESACKKGFNECEDVSGSIADKCDEFKRKCKRNCPNSIYVYSSSKGASTGYVENSNANSVCEDACAAGYRRCE